jgi:hypothetical protein
VPFVAATTAPPAAGVVAAGDEWLRAGGASQLATVEFQVRQRRIESCTSARSPPPTRAALASGLADGTVLGGRSFGLEWWP